MPRPREDLSGIDEDILEELDIGDLSHRELSRNLLRYGYTSERIRAGLERLLRQEDVSHYPGPADKRTYYHLTQKGRNRIHLV